VGARALVVVIAVVAAAPGIASAVVFSGTANLGATAPPPETLTISVTGGSNVSFALANGAAAAGSAPVVIATSWDLNPGLTGAVTLYGYFITPSQALIDGSGNAIATSLVQGRMTTGTPASYTAFTQTNAVGPAGGSLALFTESIGGPNKTKTRSDNLDLRIDLAGQLLPAGTYTGTLRIQARAL
jgi:hypothetical protein